VPLHVHTREVVLDEVAVERRRDAVHRYVVWRPAESAGDDDGVEPVAVPPRRPGDHRRLVRDGQDALHRHAALGELCAEPRGVRVRRVAREEFVADRQQGRVHVRLQAGQHKKGLGVQDVVADSSARSMRPNSARR
jgi:hypothetical protein